MSNPCKEEFLLKMKKLLNKCNGDKKCIDKVINKYHPLIYSSSYCVSLFLINVRNPKRKTDVRKTK